jgi:hypothetical protein
VDKPADQRGRFLHPELFGFSQSYRMYNEKLEAMEHQSLVPQANPGRAAKMAQKAPAAPAAPQMKGGQ